MFKRLWNRIFGPWGYFAVKAAIYHEKQRFVLERLAKKLPKFAIHVPENESVPRGYGLAHRRGRRRGYTAMIMPFNYIYGLYRRISDTLFYGAKPSAFMTLLHREYQRGREDAKRELEDREREVNTMMGQVYSEVGEMSKEKAGI